MPVQSRIRDVMHRAIVTCEVNTPAKEAAQLLSRYESHALVVFDEMGEVTGIITVSDLVKNYFRDLTGLRAEDIMSTPVITVAGSATIAEAAQIMLDHGAHQLVVLHTAEGSRRRAVGLITRAHVLKEMLTP